MFSVGLANQICQEVINCGLLDVTKNKQELVFYKFSNYIKNSSLYIQDNRAHNQDIKPNTITILFSDH